MIFKRNIMDLRDIQKCPDKSAPRLLHNAKPPKHQKEIQDQLAQFKITSYLQKRRKTLPESMHLRNQLLSD